MPATTDETVRPLNREEQRQLLLLACAADRLEWQLQARRFGRRRAGPPPWLMPAVRLGLAWLPRRRAVGPGWRHAWQWIQAGLSLFP